MDRRDFLKLVGAASGASLLLGCNLDRESEKLIPYLVPPEGGVPPGTPTFVPTSCVECPAGCGATARVLEDRPVKLEGLDGHPVTDGKLCIRGQASLNRLYLPERLRHPLMQDGNGNLLSGTWNQVADRVHKALGRSTHENVFLSSRTTGSFAALVDEFCRATGVTRAPELEIYPHAAIRKANDDVFGRSVFPWYRIDRADFLLTVGADVIGTFQNPVANIAAISGQRAAEAGFTWHHVESHATLSAFQANRHLAVLPGGEAWVLAYLVTEVRKRRIVTERAIEDALASVPEVSLDDAVSATGVARDLMSATADALLGAGRPLVVAGEVATAGDAGIEVARLAALLQAALGMVGKTVDFTRAPDYSRVGSMQDVDDLIQKLDSGGVGVLFVVRTNPVALLPDADRFRAAMQKAEYIVGIGDTLDETMQGCDVVLPLSHTLESWGDTEPRAGVVGAIQPAFKPLFDTRSDGDILIRLMKETGATPPAASYQQYVMARWRREYGADAAKTLVAKGVVEVPAKTSNPSFHGGAMRWTFSSARPKPGTFLMVTPSHRWFDGRSANLELLKEVPDPLTSVSWDKWVSVSPATARDLGVKDRDEVEIAGGAWSIRLPVRVQPGLVEGVYAVQQGVEVVPVGWSKASGEMNAVVSGVTVRSTHRHLPVTIMAGALGEQGRGIVPGHEVMRYGDEPTPREEMVGHEGVLETAQEKKKERDESFYAEPHYIDYRWAMAIDMDLCVGCAACVSACYIENNVPMVGREEHLKGREMSWIRIEPYYFVDGHADLIPTMCQHCDYAPCEPVCPVFAAYTNTEGVAVQVYNRCVGTRYCSNNCPYKQRRFNWFPWDKKRPEPLNLMINPDVSVRGKGIMEKCSLCVQRVRRARDHAEDENRKIRSDEVTTACAQACPGNAIVFGNLLDENSEVARWARSERSARILESLGTSPGVYYLKSQKKGTHHA